VAFVVREDFQGMGIATYLLEILEGIARENDYRRFTATVLKDNQAMLNVFRKHYPNAHIAITGGSEVSVVMEFDPDSSHAATMSTEPPSRE
jgi:ribosomal protein S18 acetylase RimI-like enzyme